MTTIEVEKAWLFASLQRIKDEDCEDQPTLHAETKAFRGRVITTDRNRWQQYTTALQDFLLQRRSQDEFASTMYSLLTAEELMHHNAYMAAILEAIHDSVDQKRLFHENEPTILRKRPHAATENGPIKKLLSYAQEEIAQRPPTPPEDDEKKSTIKQEQASPRTSHEDQASLVLLQLGHSER